MTKSEENLKQASDFKVLEGEATFPPPIQREVVGGMHIAPVCITRNEEKEFVMIEWPEGLPRHDSERTVRFPHGMMKFGEKIEDCAKRLVSEQLGMKIEQIRVIHIYSYMDDNDHWHIEPVIFVKVTGKPQLHHKASKTISFEGNNPPDGLLWSDEDFAEVVTLVNDLS